MEGHGPDVGMPHVLWELQGWQRAVEVEEKEPNGATVEKISHLVRVISYFCGVLYSKSISLTFVITAKFQK